MNNISINDGRIMLSWAEGSDVALLLVREKQQILTALDLDVFSAAAATAAKDLKKEPT